jgi:hypothetical protein
MPKTKISEYSATANSNTDVASINIDEGCAPSGINNAIRAIMGHLKDFQQGTNGDPFNGPHNGTVGATTPSTGAFTTLSATGAITSTYTGTYAMSSTSAGTGPTGINLYNTSGNLILGVEGSAGGALLTGSTAYSVILSSYANQAIQFGTNNALRATLDASGNLLIGGTSNARSARILSENAAGQQLGIRYTSVATWYQNVVSSGDFTIDRDGSEYLRILYATGNLGIGTTTPKIELQTKSSGGIQATNSGEIALRYNAYYDGADRYIQAANKASSVVLDSTGSILFYNTNTASSSANSTITGWGERARIDSSGNLLVGKTSFSGASGTGAFVAADGRINVVNAADTNAFTTYEAYSTGAGAFRFYVGLGGTIFATSIVITAISDQRLKENVRDIDTGLSAIMALKPRRFDWKEGKGQDKKNAAGFIAQEFETVFPECVSTSKAGEDGIEYKNINHETLIPTLVKAIQEQQAIITQLTARITALESA